MSSDALPDLYDRLFQAGHRFDFFQAMRLLEHRFADAPSPGETTRITETAVRIRPHTGLGFPATDVKAIHLHEEPKPWAEVVVTFMGLYGIGSPLPYNLYDELATEIDATEPLRDFLDLFNHRLYAFFYRAWKKYRPETDPMRHERRFLALAGLPERADFPVPARRLAAFAGFLAAPVRHAEGLHTLLNDLLNETVGIVENVPRWVALPERPALGSGDGLRAVLGETTTIGERIMDATGQFRIVLGPLTLVTFEAFLPGGTRARLLDALVRLYAPDYLDYDVQLRLLRDEIPPLRLSGPDLKLGLNTWLGKPFAAVTDRVVAYA